MNARKNDLADSFILEVNLYGFSSKRTDGGLGVLEEIYACRVQEISYSLHVILVFRCVFRRVYGDLVSARRLAAGSYHNCCDGDKSDTFHGYFSLKGELFVEFCGLSFKQLVGGNNILDCIKIQIVFQAICCNQYCLNGFPGFGFINEL